MEPDRAAQGTPWLKALAPLADPTFRRIWLASLLSNFGHLLLGVTAAWQMTRLTDSPSMVAMVQTALMLPVMLIAVPAGAMADMFDRRRIALAGLGFAIVSAAGLAILSQAGMAGPNVLLLFCFLIGSGLALHGPSWQASIQEQVPPEQLAAAVSLGSVSYNLARSVGPAIGGIVVMTLGATAAFITNTLLYIPLFIAFFFWRRTAIPPRLPPEDFGRAIISGARYALHAAPVRTAMIRTFLFACGISAIMALTPLIARDQLGGDAGVYGLLLGASGIGAVLGALVIGEIRDRLSPEQTLTVTLLASGATALVVASSRSVPLTMLAMMIGSMGNMVGFATINVTLQLSVPRWVTARALSWFQSSMTGGLAGGAVVWGSLASSFGTQVAIASAAGLIVVLPLLRFVMPIRPEEPDRLHIVEFENELNVDVAITPRSGPVVIEIDFDVDPEEARNFYNLMLDVQRVRMRNGAFGWSLRRDIGNAALWTERFEFPTWIDYLRHRARFTQADRDLLAQTAAFNRMPSEVQVRRWLERPFGSVRWRSDTPDLNAGNANFPT
jgi:MFS family permease